MLRYTISAPELQTGVCYRTITLTVSALAADRAKQLAAQIQATPASDLQKESTVVLFEVPFDQPLTVDETFTLTEAFGNPNLQWGVRENDESNTLTAYIYLLQH
ncbi:hypothetical protein [Rikenella microfusus]|uniref:Uncharacterized protein n=1 Tax=Rikenella microfusus TaxID=28139 RepID=A0A379NED2_9BACT|nr:hypothetical protein [Rikenella microfusus]SUE33126.1 Uncharacterised protein [Rikenella microfusus]SUE45227.1 Uncharacterised protein [Rikenella microfusus]HJE89325.1 hypothetical protein [Rikenella microfusus]